MMRGMTRKMKAKTKNEEESEEKIEEADVERSDEADEEGSKSECGNEEEEEGGETGENSEEEGESEDEEDTELEEHEKEKNEEEDVEEVMEERSSAKSRGTTGVDVVTTWKALLPGEVAKIATVKMANDVLKHLTMFGSGGPLGTTISADTHSQLELGDPSSKRKATTMGVVGVQLQALWGVHELSGKRLYDRLWERSAGGQWSLYTDEAGLIFCLLLRGLLSSISALSFIVIHTRLPSFALTHWFHLSKVDIVVKFIVALLCLLLRLFNPSSKEESKGSD
ncbi:hypothetical protein Scep_003827 [Stephania cephalantha]|uniref:Uncharacterized protein n=1 Tax=Stephania cephalantha TaxID=152367 RepID=A0AAP0PUU5_9MAGN